MSESINAGDYVIIDGDDAVARRVNTIVHKVAAPWHDYERKAGVPNEPQRVASVKVCGSDASSRKRTRQSHAAGTIKPFASEPTPNRR